MYSLLYIYCIKYFVFMYKYFSLTYLFEQVFNVSVIRRICDNTSFIFIIVTVVSRIFRLYYTYVL